MKGIIVDESVASEVASETNNDFDFLNKMQKEKPKVTNKKKSPPLSTDKNSSSTDGLIPLSLVIIIGIAVAGIKIILS